MNENTNSHSFAIVAAEPSGDLLGGGVVNEIKDIDHDAQFIGIGGNNLLEAGVELILNIKDISAMGLMDPLKNIKRWAEIYAKFRLLCKKKNVSAVILIDSYDLNIRLAGALKRDGVRVMWYVGPKVWAWRKNRLKVLKKRVDLVALLFKFELELYNNENIPAIYTGHPLAEKLEKKFKNCDIGILKKKILNDNVFPDAKIVSLFPGSREDEIKRHGSVLVECAALLQKQGFTPVISIFNNSTSAQNLKKLAANFKIIVWEKDSGTLLKSSEFAVAVSGTVTLEAAILETPMVIIYKIDRVSFFVGKYVLNLPYVGLPNWIAQKKIITEIFQEDVTAENISNQIVANIEHKKFVKQKLELRSIKSLIHKNDSYKKVAMSFLELVK
ncbi:MAG: lipid-A-disaccharide synthase [Deltaproteobacteria bacterium]|nr:lipid-A-disaccharide synthase [Deltaproteobacteria bacterium]